MSAPKRIQRRRTKGWRMPANSVYVGRGSKYGNPYRVSGEVTDERAVALFRDMLNRAPLDQENGETVFDEIRRDLTGKDLACWCPLDAPCHADVLLEIANGGDVGVEVRLDGINRGALLELAEEGCRSVGLPVSEARKLLEAHEYDLQHPGDAS